MPTVKEMTEKPVEIAVVIDESGSMSGVRDDAIGGFNTFITEQKKVDGEAVVTLVKFNSVAEVLYEGKDIEEVEDLTEDSYVPQNYTALYDAIGKAIRSIESRTEKGDKAIIAILTDGMENNSKEFDIGVIKKLIEDKTKDGWEFVYLAANQDAFAVGSTFGLAKGQTFNFCANAQGVSDAYSKMSARTTNYRSGN